MQILDKQDGLRQYAGPGHWNAPDMMEVGNLRSVSESRAHFPMWAMLAAPLIAGNDIRDMPKAIRKILTNEDVIAVNQDPLGIQGFDYRTSGDMEVWFKPLAGGDWAMALLNRGDEVEGFTFDWLEEPVADGLSGRATDFANTSYQIRDLWAKELLGTTEGTAQFFIERTSSGLITFEHFAGRAGDGHCMRARYHDDPVSVGHDDITWTYQCTPDLDGLVDGFDHVAPGPNTASALLGVYVQRNLLLDDFVGVADASGRDDAAGPFRVPGQRIV